MADYHKYRELMSEAREATRSSADILKRIDLPMEERRAISDNLTKRAAALRREAMIFAKSSAPAFPR